MKCKYVEKNRRERKCGDYYYSHAKNKEGVYCRLVEWKRKKKVCPYDKTIFSKPKKIIKQIKDKRQTTLK
jgi:hypothetical protein